MSLCSVMSGSSLSHYFIQGSGTVAQPLKFIVPS